MELTLGTISMAVVLLGLLLLLARLLRRRITPLRTYHIPSSLVAGLIGLLLGPQVLGRFFGGVGGDGWLGFFREGAWPEGVVFVWRELPAVLISVVFAGLFLGKDIPSPKRIWHLAGPHAAFGQTVAWGQYVVGIGITLLVLQPYFGTPEIAGALLDIGFEGGHGTAAGLGTTFESLGWPAGESIALGLATIGLILGIVLGTIMVNIAARTSLIPNVREGIGGGDPGGTTEDEPSRTGRVGPRGERASDRGSDRASHDRDAFPKYRTARGAIDEARDRELIRAETEDPDDAEANRKGHPAEELDSSDRADTTDEGRDCPAGGGRSRGRLTDPLTPQIGWLALSIAIGWLILKGLVWLEDRTWGTMMETDIIQHVPLFPLAMIGSVIVQLSLDALGLGHLTKRRLIKRISGTSMDLIVAGAIAALSLGVLAAHWQALAILAGVGVLWNVGALVFLAPRMFPNFWFTRSLGDFGQSMGMTIVGLLLIRIADPENETPAVDGFGYKQRLFEPFVGGGLFTAVSMPLIAQFGAIPVLVFTAVMLALFLWLGIGYFGKRDDEGEAARRGIGEWGVTVSGSK